MSTYETTTPQKTNGHAHLPLAELDNATYITELEEMPPRTHDDIRELAEVLVKQFADMDRRAEERHKEVMAGNNARRPPSWASLALSLVALLGAGSVWIGNSGYVVGGANSKIVQLEKQVADEQKLREKFEEEYKGKHGHLRDLYMLKFGEDPDTVDTSKLKRK